MLDQIGNIATLLIIGAIIVRIFTNKNSQGILGTVFHGFAEDVNASVGTAP